MPRVLGLLESEEEMVITIDTSAEAVENSEAIWVNKSSKTGFQVMGDGRHFHGEDMQMYVSMDVLNAAIAELETMRAERDALAVDIEYLVKEHAEICGRDFVTILELQKRVAELERVMNDQAVAICEQVHTTRLFAKDSSMGATNVSVMEICTSHFLDYAAALRRAALSGEADTLQSVLADLAAKQEPLGAEFEAALADRDRLYGEAGE